jgi:two-component system, LytTR family, response regulator
MVTGKIKSVIVEDERSAREALKAYLLKYCPQVEVAGEAQDARQAETLIKTLQPQLVFLDVELPFGNAFDILDACKELRFETIFVTAFSEYSLKALNQSAAYYLLKPVSIEELVLAVDKVSRHLADKEAFDRNAVVVQNFREQQAVKRLVVLPTLEGFEVIKMDEIIRLQGNGNFTDIFLVNGTKKMACRFLKHYDELLPFPFVRVHKSHIINIEHVKQYHKNAGGYVVLSDKTEVDISANYKEHFLSFFK